MKEKTKLAFEAMYDMMNKEKSERNDLTKKKKKKACTIKKMRKMIRKKKR